MQVQFVNEKDFIKYKFKTKPYKHQEEIFNKIKDLPNYALLMEQGTGKTKVSIKAKIDDKDMCVPLDPANRHYQAIQEWVAEGNKIEDAD